MFPHQCLAVTRYNNVITLTSNGVRDDHLNTVIILQLLALILTIRSPAFCGLTRREGTEDISVWSLCIQRQQSLMPGVGAGAGGVQSQLASNKEVKCDN